MQINKDSNYEDLDWKPIPPNRSFTVKAKLIYKGKGEPMKYHHDDYFTEDDLSDEENMAAMTEFRMYLEGLCDGYDQKEKSRIYKNHITYETGYKEGVYKKQQENEEINSNIDAIYKAVNEDTEF